MRCLLLGPPVLSGPRSGSGGFSFQNEGAFTNIFHLLGVLVLEGLKDAITYIPCGGPRTGAQAARLSPDGCSPVSASPPSLISSCWNSEKVKEAKQAYFLKSTGFCPQQPPRACSISVPVAAVVLFASGPSAPTVNTSPPLGSNCEHKPPTPVWGRFPGDTACCLWGVLSPRPSAGLSFWSLGTTNLPSKRLPKVKIWH